MSELTPSVQLTAEEKDLLKTKRARRRCVAIFVVFLIALLAFGKSPMAGNTGTDGTRVNFNVISCLGICGGIFAIIFLLTGWRRVLHLSKARATLGLIGGLGLIAHTILAFFMPLQYGASNVPPPGVGDRLTLAQNGPERWVADGQAYQVTSTYYLQLPEGLQYTIEYPHNFDDYGRMTDEIALEIAFPVMKYAYLNGLHNRFHIRKLGQGSLSPSRIGVALVEGQGARVRGYRVALTLDQIKERIGQASPLSPTTPAKAAGE